MKFLKAERQTTQYYFLVHMDESKLVQLEPDTAPVPDPAYVREFVYGIPVYKTEDMTEGYLINNETDREPVYEPEYLESIKREIGLLVADELSRMNPQPAPEPIPLEGF